MFTFPSEVTGRYGVTAEILKASGEIGERMLANTAVKRWQLWTPISRV